MDCEHQNKSDLYHTNIVYFLILTHTCKITIISKTKGKFQEKERNNIICLIISYGTVPYHTSPYFPCSGTFTIIH